jgi:hypothetical protein
VTPERSALDWRSRRPATRPSQLPHALLGGLAGPRPPTTVVRVEPTVVVEVSVDTAFERGRWRHIARFVRIRADIEPGGITIVSLASPT